MMDVVELISEKYMEAGYIIRDEIKLSGFSEMSVLNLSGDNDKDAEEFTTKVTDMLNVPKEHTIQMVSAYTVGGKYIGTVKNAEYLCDELGIYPETIFPDDSVCSIGFSRKNKKWYGWSHRAIYGFKVGDIVKKGDCCATSGWTDKYIKEHPDEKLLCLPVGFVAKDMFDAKRMAIAFADSVS